MIIETESSADNLNKSSDLETDEEDIGTINRPFDPEKIKMRTETRSLDLILRRIEYKEIDMAPDFQRRARVWPEEKKGRLIESLLLNIPLPVFYVCAFENGDWAVVDGLQRLTTVSDYTNNVFKLKNLEYLKNLEGKVFDDLPRSLKRRIEETSIVIHVIEPGTPEDVMINIFKRINTGGEPLKAQEIRNALAKGPVRDFLNNLAKSEAFLSAAGKVNDKRMDAQECISRFFAFFLCSHQEYGDSDLDSFILSTMHKISKMTESERNNLKNIFERSMVYSKDIFQEYAFRKFDKAAGRRGPVSKALFEAVSVNLARLDDKKIKILLKRREDVLNSYLELMNDQDFMASISAATGSKSRVIKRFDAINTVFSENLR